METLKPSVLFDLKLHGLLSRQVEEMQRGAGGPLSARLLALASFRKSFLNQATVSNHQAARKSAVWLEN